MEGLDIELDPSWDFEIDEISTFRDFRAELKSPDFRWDAYVMNEVPIGIAIGMADLLYPRFVLCEGLLLRKAVVPDVNFKKLKTYGKTDQQREGLLNHLHIYDAFKFDDGAEDGVGVPDVMLQRLAVTMGRSWKAAAAEQFPNIETCVHVFEGYGPEVWIYRLVDEPLSVGSHPNN